MFVCGCGRNEIERVEWPVMGTIAAVQWQGDGEGMEEAVASVKEVFAEVERLLDAHDPESELSRFASKSDGEILYDCNPLVRDCYRMAIRLREESKGVFNPRWRGKGTLDLGGIAKGFAVDLAAERIVKAAQTNRILIDLGGNLKAIGGNWQTAVYSEGREPTVFTLSAGEACATSAKYFRGDHIKDGRDGSSVTDAPYSVTVIHPGSAMIADGLSTICFILGREKAEAYIRAHHPSARTIWLTP